MRIAFAGTPRFALSALNALVKARHDIVGVWTQPDRPAGRGRKLSTSAVKQRALELRLPVHQPGTFKSVRALAEIKTAAPDVMVVAAYGLLLPSAVLGIPRHGCLNIHASLLPRWRGAAPIQRAILAGDAETGVTIMQMNSGLDTGDMLAVRRTKIHDTDTAQTLHDRLALSGADAMLEVLAQLPGVRHLPQDHTQATYAAKLSRGEAALDWTLSAVALARRVRAYNPWPVAYARWQGKVLRIWRAWAVSTAVGAVSGTVINADRRGIDVATGDGVLHIDELQPAGGRIMSAADFNNARSLAGTRFD